MLTLVQKRGGASERGTSFFVSVGAVVCAYRSLSSLSVLRPEEGGVVT